MFRAAAFVIAASVACAAPAAAQSAPNSSAAPPATASPANAPVSAVDAARARVAAGDLAGAIGALSAYATAHPEDAAAARYLGDLYYRKSDFGAAERAYLAALRVTPNDRQTHDRLGVIYASEDRVHEAIQQFQASLPDAAAYDSLVELHRRLGDLASFEGQYAFAAIQNPLDSGALFALGVVLHAERKTASAIGYLERAHALSRDSCPIETELGSAYLDVGATDAAIGVFKDCLHRSPNDYAALVNLSDAYDPVVAEKQVRDLLEHASAIAPDRPEALVDLGYLQDAGGRWHDAVAYYLKAMDVDPLWRDAYVDLGFDYEQHQMFDPAQAVLLKGLSVSPKDGRLHFLLGMAYLQQDKRDLARSEFRSAQGSDEPDVAREATRRLATTL
jgi:tetratricopeptide (TPR) repeat protein